MMKAISLFFVSAVLLCGPLFADEVHFKNGDRLTGTIKTLTDGKMTFESTLAGTVTVDLANIATFQTEAPIQIHLDDGTVLNDTVEPADKGLFTLSGQTALQQQDIPVDRVAAINPPPKPEPKWTGSIAAGLASTHGNTKTENTNLDFQMQKRSEKDRTTLGANYLRGKQEDPDTGKDTVTENEWMITGKYDYYFTKKMYGFLDGRYEKDSIAELDRRVILGGGGGYQWIESDTMNFATEVGLASLYEKFDNQTESSTELSARLGYLFDKKINDKLKFIHDLTYYPSLEEFSDYFLTTKAELRASMLDSMFVSFKTIFDYDASPAIGKTSTDTKYLLGVGWDF